MTGSYRKRTKMTRKGSKMTRIGSKHRSKARKHTTKKRRNRIGGLLLETGKFESKNVLEAARRGEQGVPIANQYGSDTLLATEAPTIA